MREKFVGTKLGNMLLSASRWMSLRGIPIRNPECASAIANAILADRLIQHLCAPGGTFLDVGAHIGSIFSSVRDHDKSVKVIAIEADPQKAQSLRKRFSYCDVIEIAAGVGEGTAAFYLNPKATGYNSLVVPEESGRRTITVRVAAIDDLLRDVCVDVMKIDIEGAELGALRGSENLVRRSQPTIMFESMGKRVNSLGYSSAQLWKWFHDMNYVVVTPDRLAHDAPPLSLDTFLDAHDYPFRSCNYFAVAGARRTEIRDRARRILGILSADRAH